MHVTPENRLRLRATVFGKTAAGRAELGQRSAGLTARQRSVLILLDGQKPLGQIESWLPEDEMLEAVESLLRRGMAGIVSAPPGVAGTAAAIPAAPSAPAAPAPKVLEARELMAAAARKHLGLLAADLVHRIEQAHDHGQLAGVIGLWHVSLRESKTGKHCAEGLLAEARGLLRTLAVEH